MNSRGSKAVFAVLLFSVLLIVVFQVAVLAESESMVIEDMLGRQVEVPTKVARVVGLEAGALRLITYLRATELVVGVENIEKTDHKRPYILAHPELAKLPSIGPIHGGDPEMIFAQQPDVILWTYTTVGEANNLQEKTGIPVVGLTYGGARTTVREDLYSALRLAGEILDKQERAQKVIDYINGEIARLRARVDQSPEVGPEVYVGGIASRGTHGICSTEPAYPPFEFLGLDNIAGGLGLKHVTINEEKLLQWDPKYVFIDQSGLSLVKNDLTRPQFSLLTALRKDNFYGLLPYNYYTTNFGTVLADTYYVGKIMYPDKFADVDPEQKANEIYMELVGKPVYAAMAEIFGGFKRLDIC